MPKKPSKIFGQSLTLQQAQDQFNLYAPRDRPLAWTPSFMNKTPQAPRKAPNLHEEKTFMDRLFKLALCRTDLWLRKNAQGTARTMDGQRFLKYGLGVGTSDGIGFISRTVTPEDVGKKWAVFCAVEGKAAEGRLTTEQAEFLATVRSAGGVALVAYASEELSAVIDRLK